MKKLRIPLVLVAFASIILATGGPALAFHTPGAGPYFPGMDVAVDIEEVENTSGYLLHANGTVQAYGDVPPVTVSPNFGFNIARALEITFEEDSGPVAGYVLTGWGSLHRWQTAGAPAPPDIEVGPYWPGWDIARDFELNNEESDTENGFIMTGWGSLHPFAAEGDPLPELIEDGPYWPGWDIARDLEVISGDGAAAAGLVLDGWGGLHSWHTTNAGNEASLEVTGYWPGWDIARDAEEFDDNATFGGYVLTGWGSLHPFGDPGTTGGDGPFWPGWDIARDLEIGDCSDPSLAMLVLDGWGGRHAAHQSPCTES